MAINYKDDKYQGKYVYLPVMGETAIFDIAEIGEVKSEDARFNFSEKVPVMANGEQVVDDDGEPVFKKKDLGYHVEARLKNGKILSVTSMAAFLAVFKKHEIQDGDRVKIFHKDKGEWEVTKVTDSPLNTAETKEMQAQAAEIADAYKQCESIKELNAAHAVYGTKIQALSPALKKWLEGEYNTVAENL